MTRQIKKELTTVSDKDLQNLMEEIGYEENLGKDDIAIPILKIVQKTSDDLLEIDGVNIGDIYNTASGEVYSIKEGLKFIPIYCSAVWVTRIPYIKGGGLISIDAGKPLDIDYFEDGHWYDSEEKEKEALYTHYHTIVLPDTMETALIIMNSTQLKISKRWNVVFRKVKPTFINCYMAFTEEQSNQHTKWRGWQIPKQIARVAVDQLHHCGAVYKEAREYDVTASTISQEETPVVVPTEYDDV